MALAESWQQTFHTSPNPRISCSADALFTRAGIVKPGAAGSLGHAAAPAGTGDISGRSSSRRTGPGGGGGGGGGGEASRVRRCTIKRIHVETHRVLGEAASFREFRIALSTCVRGGGGGNNSAGSGMEWITVDQLDHALRTCHLTRRALDPQVCYLGGERRGLVVVFIYFYTRPAASVCRGRSTRWGIGAAIHTD